MVVLRSREVLPPPPKPTPQTHPKGSTSEPATPVQAREPSVQPSPSSPDSNPQTPQSAPDHRGKTCLLDLNSPPEEGSAGNPDRESNHGVFVERLDNEGNVFDIGSERDVGSNLSGVLSLRSGKRVSKRIAESRGDKFGTEVGRQGEKDDGGARQTRGMDKGKRKVQSAEEDVVHYGEEGTVRIEECGVVIEKLGRNHLTEDTSSWRRKFDREEKGKGKLVDDEPEGEMTLGRNQTTNDGEKGKGKLVNDDCNLSMDGNDILGMELQSKIKDLVESLSEIVPLKDGKQGMKEPTGTKQPRMEQFRDIARKNASRFAHFNSQEEGEGPSSPELDEVIPNVEEEQKIEDWPGPFSTAMKIIRDRANKLNLPQGTSSSGKAKSAPITWIPKNNQGSSRSKTSVPSLQDLCIKILVKNADAVTSLESVPDILRHRICQLLSDSRRMNGHFLGLLVCGSPTEIRIRDCSWLSEEEFTNCFERCNTSSLMVLQLDQCGRCLPDYILPTTLARSPNSLPALTSLSLSGACRLSDVGFRYLISSTPALKSLNISRCSLLTPASIEMLANSLGSVLQELYIDDCPSIDAMLILPPLKKLKNLQVLSVAGVQTVCDDFLREFLVACGQNMKELILTDCVKLTDSSVKVIAETCPGLCSLNLANLGKLTDSALGYLANGCREIRKLKFCRNTFSDEAIAAFVESSGELLEELSLNNVKMVAHNTALSLAKRSRMLQILDLSWCRNLTDEAVGLIVDSCLSLKDLKLFGCGQITSVFVNGHSNPGVEIIGLKMSPVLQHLPRPQEFALQYSSVSSSV